MGVFFHMDAAFGENIGGIFLSVFLFRENFMKFLREKQKPYKRVSISIGALLETWKGSFAEIFERKKGYLGSFLRHRVYLIFYDMIFWGTKGQSIRPRCIGTQRTHTEWQ